MGRTTACSRGLSWLTCVQRVKKSLQLRAVRPPCPVTWGSPGMVAPQPPPQAVPGASVTPQPPSARTSGDPRPPLLLQHQRGPPARPWMILHHFHPPSSRTCGAALQGQTFASWCTTTGPLDWREALHWPSMGTGSRQLCRHLCTALTAVYMDSTEITHRPCPTMGTLVLPLHCMRRRLKASRWSLSFCVPDCCSTLAPTSVSSAARSFLHLMGWRSTCGGLTAAPDPLPVKYVGKHSAMPSAWSNTRQFTPRKEVSIVKSAVKALRDRPRSPHTYSSTRTPGRTPASTAARGSTRSPI